jgi:MYXO-CTERM domain-containing protein
VKRPSGLNGCPPTTIATAGFTDAAWGLPLFGAAAVAGALFLRRRGEQLSR